ncbi:hypothetical protein [Streptomyces olivoreticuli]|uniref:hypothetical protein n=1 Tax=Streptomyces olivoreticuli TaxID=68246 RepID=UPI000E2307E8|nr:hypothetical protein [Streptomyces olivoreticuli]
MLHWVLGARHPVADGASAAPEADGGDALPTTVRVPVVLPGTVGLLAAGMRPVTEVRRMTARLPAWRDPRLSGKQFTLIDPEPPLIFRAATETRNTTELLRRRGTAELLWPADQQPRGEPPDGVPPGVADSPVAQPRHRVVIPLFPVRSTVHAAAAGTAGTGATVIELRPRAGEFRTTQVSRITTSVPGRLSGTAAIAMTAGANGGVPGGLLAEEGMSSG